MLEDVAQQATFAEANTVEEASAPTRLTSAAKFFRPRLPRREPMHASVDFYGSAASLLEHGRKGKGAKRTKWKVNAAECHRMPKLPQLKETKAKYKSENSVEIVGGVVWDQ